MSRPLTTNAKGWQRIGRVVQEVEGSPLLSTRGRAKYPIATGSGTKLAIIREASGEDAVAIYKGKYPDGFDCVRNLDDEDTFKVHCDFANGVFFTGQRILIQRFRWPEQEARWQVVSAGCHQWTGTAEDLVPTGNATINYYRDSDATGATCVVTAESFNENSPVTGDCWIMFDDATPFDSSPPGLYQAFVAIKRNCPTYVAEEE